MRLGAAPAVDIAKGPFPVIAPALIPVAPGDRVKTDKRDARRLVRQFRAGELIAIGVPSCREEVVRELCRALWSRTQSPQAAPRTNGS